MSNKEKLIVNIMVCILTLIGSTHAIANPANMTAKEVTYSYIMKMKLPCGITNASSVLCYYQGHELRCNTGCILLSEKQERLAFSLIITPEVEHKAIKNNVWYLKRLPDLPCRWFDLTLSFETNGQNKLAYRWLIEERNINDVPLRIPDHAIVIQTDPTLIEKLEPSSSGCDDEDRTKKMLNHAITIYFPTIIFKKDLSKQSFEAACVHPLLAAIDARAIHQTRESLVNDEITTVSSMPRKKISLPRS